MRIFVYTIVFIVLVFSCAKKEDRRCWKVAGELTSKEVAIPSFDKLFIGPHLTVNLVEDDSSYAIIKGHENLVNLVSTEVDENGLLRLENRNKCNFLRKYDTKKMEVELHCANLVNIEYQGTEPLTNSDTLHIGWFTLLIQDGSGSVDLTVDSQFLFASIGHGYGDFTFRGKSNYAKLYIRSNGYCNTEQLVVKDSLDVVNGTPVNSYINANVPQVRAEVSGSGNVYYKGNPGSLVYHRYGLGELIDNN